MTNVDKRKMFMINTAYLLLVSLIVVAVFKFTFAYLMPFVVGFIIASLSRPIVKKLDDIFGENKIVSILVNVAFYIIVAILVTWIVFRSIALIQYYIPLFEKFFTNTLIPMIDALLTWFEGVVQSLDPKLSGYVDKTIPEIIAWLEQAVELFSRHALNWITKFISSTPSIFVSILLSVISSFFFSVDYQNVVNSMLGVLPEKGKQLVLDIKNIFSIVVGKYLVAYMKLMFLTFVELSIGFSLLRMNNAILLAAIISVVDILPVLGTGTILIPWTLYEFILGDPGMGLGILTIYIIVTVIRNILEPKVIGKQIGLHPLLTLVSITVGVKLFGFLGLFALPICVTIFKTLQDEGKISLRAYFEGESGIRHEKEVNIEIETSSKES